MDLITMPFSQSSAATHETITGVGPAQRVEICHLYLVTTGTNTVTIGDSTLYTDEVQTITVSDGAGADEFTVTYSGQTTGAILWDDTEVEMLAALEALSNIAPGDVAVTYEAAEDGGVFTITFGGTLAHTNVAEMTSTPTGCTVVHATTTAGVGTSTALTGAMPTAALGKIEMGNGSAPVIIGGDGEDIHVVVGSANLVAGVIGYRLADAASL